VVHEIRATASDKLSDCIVNTLALACRTAQCANEPAHGVCCIGAVVLAELLLIRSRVLLLL
jgi:hypothetical protein